jgi:hypothetical protein
VFITNAYDYCQTEVAWDDIAPRGPARLSSCASSIQRRNHDRRVQEAAVLAFATTSILLSVVAVSDDRSEALAIIRRLGGDYSVDRDKPGMPVVSVKLSNPGRTGEGLTCLRAFPDLRELDLTDLEDADRQLTHLQGLNQVKEIHLDRSSMTDAGMKHLQGLHGLETLTLGATHIGDEGLKYVAGLKNLRWLEFGGNRGITDKGLAAVRDLTRLRRLYAHRTGITDAGMAHLDRLTDMTMLMLPEGLTDEGIKHLAGMTKLTFLEISDSPITGKGISVLSGMGDLKSLYLINTRIGDDGLETIGRLHKLEVLNLSGSKITDGGVKQLEGLGALENLVLEHTLISDACLDSLGKLKRLLYIHLTDTRVTEAGAKELRTRLPNLQMLLR